MKHNRKISKKPVLILLFLWLNAGGCARLRVVEKETYDAAADTYTYKYKNLPVWAEYALGTVVGAVWGLATLAMFMPSKPQPKKKTVDRKVPDAAEAKVDDMFNTYGEERILKKPR